MIRAGMIRDKDAAAARSPRFSPGLPESRNFRTPSIHYRGIRVQDRASRGRDRPVSRQAACIYRRQIETVFAAGSLTGLTDGQLLERFARGEGDEAGPAFALLVERHGPMVLRVCRGVLRDPHDAEDAFQATFLVLVHRPRTIRKRESLGPWLHGVALRVAACARTKMARRRAHERRWGERQRTSERAADADHADLRHAIHDEIGRLP